MRFSTPRFVVLGAALVLGAGCGPSRAPGAAAATGGAGAAGMDAPAGETTGPAEAGADADGPAGPRRSAGCGLPPSQIFQRYVEHAEVVPDVPAAFAQTYTNRVYYVRLPAGYDPDRAYPLALLGPGCGVSGSAPLPLEAASKADAIIVGLNGVDNCFNKDAVDSPELPYFDETLARVEAEFCVDEGRVFVAGFSSGSYLTNLLGCARGNRLRGQGSSAGGLPVVPACTGPVAAMFAADSDDPKNPVAGVMVALERVRVANGCGTETEPYDFGVPSPCVRYKGCMPDYPLVWCLTSGQGHVEQSTSKISTEGFWHFWSSLP